jgi:diacylglycerol kinase family enzyme
MNGHSSLIDLGIVECLSNGQRKKQMFVNFAAAGLAAEVAKITNARFRRYGGRLAYRFGVLSRVLHYENNQVWIVVDGECRKVRVCSILIHNGRYGGGGMLLAPGAKLTDQLFDIIEIGDLGRFELVRWLPRVYRGSYFAHPKVSATVAKGISIDSEQKLLVQADGNLVGETPATFTILPSALTIIS